MAHWGGGGGLLRHGKKKYNVIFSKYIEAQGNFVLNISEKNDFILGKLTSGVKDSTC